MGPCRSGLAADVDRRPGPRHGARRLGDRDRYGILDASVVGTKTPAEQGTRASLVSGPADIIDRVRPVLAALASRITVVAYPGWASTLKLVCNAWVATLTAGTAQSTALAQTAGLDPQLFLAAIKDFAVDSAYAQLKGPVMINAAYDDAAFPVRGLLKDLGLIGGLAQSTGTSAALIKTLQELFTQADTAGHGEHDMAAVCTQF